MARALFPDIYVNGEHISNTDIAAEAQNQPAPRGKPGIAWRKATRALAIRTLLLQECKKRNLDAMSRELAPNQWETEDDAAIRHLLEDVIETGAADEAMMKEIYRKHPERFMSPALYVPAHILVAAPPQDEEARKKARDRVDTLLAILRQTPDAFERLAREESDCPSKEQGGQMGQITPGETVPEFEAALADLKEGDITSEPVETRYGFHIIRLDVKEEGTLLPFDMVKGQIADMIEKTTWARSAHSFVTELINTAEITGIDLNKPI